MVTKMRTGMISRILLLALVGVSIAAVHPEAVLKSSQSVVEAGGDLPLIGEEFGDGGMFTLVLLGALNEYTLRDVEASEDGTFTIDLAIPANVRPGNYQLVAFAPDGDRAATLDVSVTAASPAATEEGPDDAGERDENMASGATAEEMMIQRSTTGMGWGVIGLLIGLAGGFGLALLRGAPSLEA